MKFRDLANRFLLIVVMTVLACGALAMHWTPTLPLATPADVEEESETTLTPKTYYFDQYNSNKPTNEKSLYTALGVMDYHQYLTKLAEEQALNEIVVAVVDTGLDKDNPVFAGRILEDYAMDFSTDLPTAQNNAWDVDQNGHGTHVAGILADLTLSNVKILPIKIFSGFGNTGNGYGFENAVRYLCALKNGESVRLYKSNGQLSGLYNQGHHKVDNIVAVNLSLGTSGFKVGNASDMAEYQREKGGYTSGGITYTGYQNVVDNLLKNEILPIVAAGNRESDEYDGLPYYSLPGACNGVLAVSAYDNTDGEYSLASFSYYNDYVSLAAPGSHIWSACSDDIVNTLKKIPHETQEHTGYTDHKYNYGSTSNPKYITWSIRNDADGNFYLRESGTSMATPFVTACYALLMSDSSKIHAEDYGLGDYWDPEDADADFMNMAHKALLAAAATQKTLLPDVYKKIGMDYEIGFGYGTLTVGIFVPEEETGTVHPLVNINYEIQASTTYQNAVINNEAATDDTVDWLGVCVILFIGVIIIWLINHFKSCSMRRHTDDNNTED